MQSLRSYTTFRINTNAKQIIEIESIHQLRELIRDTSQTYHILGQGANSVFLEDYPHTILVNRLIGKKIISDTENEVVIEVSAGENRDSFVQRSLNEGYAGLENLVAIPSSVGASPVQNIGAYGKEVAEHIVAVDTIDMQTGELKKRSADQCEFGYRTSIFKKTLKQSHCIVSVTFKLAKQGTHYQPNIEYGDIKAKLIEQGRVPGTLLSPVQVAYAIMAIRASKLPNYEELGTAGSFFENPIINEDEYERLNYEFPEILKYFSVGNGKYKLSAGQLIELCGLKGYRIGDAGVYEKHALILLNHNNASTSDLKSLIRHIIDQVQQKFKITLRPEVNIYGDF